MFWYRSAINCTQCNVINTQTQYVERKFVFVMLGKPTNRNLKHWLTTKAKNTQTTQQNNRANNDTH